MPVAEGVSAPSLPNIKLRAYCDSKLDGSDDDSGVMVRNLRPSSATDVELKFNNCNSPKDPLSQHENRTMDFNVNVDDANNKAKDRVEAKSGSAEVYSEGTRTTKARRQGVPPLESKPTKRAANTTANFKKNATIGPYRIGKTLGSGSTGKVKLGTHVITNQKVPLNTETRTTHTTFLLGGH